MSTPIGNGPDNTGLIVLDDQLQPVDTSNRADFDIIIDIGSAPSPPPWIAQGIARLTNLLPMGPTLSLFQQEQKDGQQKYYNAVGVKAEASLSGRVRALLNLAGVSGGWSNGISRFLPELSAGFSIGWDDSQTLMAGKVEIGLPHWVEQQFKAWQRSLTVTGVNPDIGWDVGFELTSKESWAPGELYSRVDAVDGVSGAFTFTNEATGLGVNVKFTSELSTWSVVIKSDGQTRLVNVYRRSAEISAESVTDLQGIGISVGPNGRIGEDEWTIVDANGRPLDVNIIRDGQGRLFIGETDITESAKDSGLYNAVKNASTTGTPDDPDEIVVTAKPFDIARRYELTGGGILNKDSGRSIVTDPVTGDIVVIARGQRPGDATSATITTADGNREIAIFSDPESLVSNAIPFGKIDIIGGDVFVNGVKQSGPVASEITHWADANADDSDRLDRSVFLDAEGNLGLRVTRNGVTRRFVATQDGTQHIYADGENYDVLIKDGNTEITIRNNPLAVDFSDIGRALGQQLGYRLAGGDLLGGILASATLSTLGNNLGDALDELVGGGKSVGDALSDGFSSFGDELLTNLRAAGVGALSSFLTAELVSAIGLDGFAGETFNSVGGAVISQITTNILNGDAVLFDVGPQLVLTAAASFLGSKLGNEIYSPDTVGGQIGAAVGATIGGIVAKIDMAAFLVTGNPLYAVAAVVAVAVWQTIGALIGSIFGGTPRSGADSQWDASQNKFVVANVWSRKGGSKDAAKSIASVVSETYNSILAATGGTLINPYAVQSGSYGMRKKDFVYRPSGGGSDRGDITQRFSGKDAAQHLIGYGVYQGLSDPDFKIAGGDIYVKRALYNTFGMGGIDPLNFDTSILLGNIASAQSYEKYLQNSTVINALVSAEPNSVFTIETLLTLARADELGLTRRAASDWFGGFSFLLAEAGTNAANVDFGFDYDPASGQISRLIGIGQYTLGDAIDIAGQTAIEGTAAGETIDMRSGSLADQRGYTVNGHLNNDIAATGADFTAKTATLTFAAGDLRKTVDVAIAADGLAEATETFLGTLSNAPGMQIMGGEAVATVIDGGAALPTLMVGNSYAWEGDGYAVFRLSLSKAAGQPVTVALALAGDRASGLGVDFGSAGASNIQVSADGVNWTNYSGGATFAVGVKELFVRTAVIADNVANPAYVPGGTAPEYLNIEGNERFTLSANVTGGAAALANGTQTVSGTGTFVDGAGTEPMVWIDDVIVDEASGTARFTVSRSRTAAASTTVDFATSDRRVLNIDIAATVDGGDGNDTIYASDKGDNLFGGAGNDIVYGGRLDDWLLGGDGNDLLFAAGPAGGALGGDGNYLNGGAGDDVMTGAEGSDWLEGGDGNDTLVGGAGDDILAGGAGVDSAWGGEGADYYLFRRGDGADTAEDGLGAIGTADSLMNLIAAKNAGSVARDWAGADVYSEQGARYTGNDRVVFGAGIGLADIQLKRSGTVSAPGMDLIVVVTQNGVVTGDQLTLKGWFDSFKRVEWLEFADGQAIRIGDFSSFVTGTPGNDVFYGTNGNDFVVGGEGRDFFSLAGGNDVGIGGAGEDEIGGDDGNDILIGGSDNDLILGGDGHDVLSGDAGDDRLNGGLGNDLLTGGRGNDFLAGGRGNDIFRISRGDGLDTIIDDYAGTWETVWTGAGWGFGYGYDAATNRILKNGSEVIFDGTKWIGEFNYNYVTSTGVGELIRLIPSANGQVGKDESTSDSDSLEFGLGINIQDLVLRKDGNDLIVAISSENGNDTVFANIGDRITLKDWFVSTMANAPIERFLFAATGSVNMNWMATSLQGTDVNDTLGGTWTPDWITGGGGDDSIIGYGDNDILNGNAGQDTVEGHTGDDILYGGEGDDILIGGPGKDVLSGGQGTDTASYITSGATIYAYLDAAAMNAGDALGDSYYSVESLIGGTAADHLGGDSGENILNGRNGSDVLLGGLGDDTYVFDTWMGSDTIQDGKFTIEEVVNASGILGAGYTVEWTYNGVVNSSHQYRLVVRNSGGEIALDGYYNYTSLQSSAPAPSAWAPTDWKNGFGRVGSTVQVTREKMDASIDGGSDVLELGSGISLADLSASWSGSDLTVSTSMGTVTIKNQTVANQRVESLHFYDGLSANLVNLRLNTNGQDSLDDLILGTGGNDTLSGLSGNDVISGGYGSDSLYGNDGDDVLEGGGHGDRLDGGAGVDTARYVRSASAVTVDLNLSTAQSGGDAAGDTLFGIENLVGSIVGNDVLTGNAGDNVLSGLDGNDTLVGGAGKDVLLGDLGDDNLSGGDGEDNIAGSDGNDTASGGNDKDIIDGGAGADTLHGDAGDDILVGGSENDLLYGDDGNDTLIGGEHDDTLWGGIGNDTLSGDAGNDLLQGEAGDDIYVFSAHSGADTVIDASGTNGIMFDGSVDWRNIWLARVGNDLRISVVGGTSQITVSNFYAGSGATTMRYIATPSYALYLAYAQPLIDQMSAVSLGAPAAVPSAITSTQDDYWWAGGKASPIVSDIALTTNEDVASAPQGIGAIDHDQNITAYSIAANGSHGVATIDPVTGVFSYLPSANYFGTDSFVVAVKDADGRQAQLTVNVTINPVNDAPTDMRVADGSAISVIEGATGSPTVADSPVEQFAATDVDGDALSWSLMNDAGGRFAITMDGLLVAQSPGLLDRESAISHSIRVRAVDPHGAAVEKDFTVTVENWNEAPDTPLLSDSRGMVAEPVPTGLAGTWVARFTLSDVDGTTPALRLVSNPANRFQVVGNEVRFANGFEPDFETLYNSGLSASDSDGDGQMEVMLTGSVDASDGALASPGSRSFSIRVEDVNEAPTALNWSPSVASVAERDRVAIGTQLPTIAIGALSVVDPDIAGFADASYSYVVSDSRFEVVGNVLRLKLGATLDYEAGSSVSLTVTATDQSAAPLSIQRVISLVIDNQDDILEGDGNDNSLIGQQNRDLLYGYGGNDYLDGADGDDMLYGGAGNDAVHGKNGNDTVYGGDGADALYGGVGNDALYGGANDTGTYDTIYGGDENDQLYGEDGDDILLGGLGSDLLNGGAGSDWADYSLLRSGEADTTGVTADLVTPASNTGAAQGDSYSSIENLRGTGVVDTLNGDASANKIEGLAGNDILRGRAGDDSLFGGAGNDSLYGDDGADSLQGDDGDDIIYGGAGNDTLLGGAGADQLYAESGDDYLDGGTGNDTLSGGIDNDTYIVTRSSDADTIYNYDPSGNDIDVLGFQDSQGAINDEDLWFEQIGNDMRISVVATTSSVLIKDWYLISDPSSRANYKIDFIVANNRYSKQINVEALVQLMASKTKPTTTAQRDALMADTTYHAQWATYWGTNAKPVIASIGNRSVNEDGTLSFTVTATDDITPNANIQMSATVISGSNVIADTGLVFGTPNSSGQRTFTIAPVANKSGTATIRVQATDAGGVTETQEFIVTVNAVVDTPTVTQFVGGSGTAGQPGGIPLTLNVTFPDADGSEFQEIWISGVPAGITLSAGTDSGSGVWKLTQAQAAGLKVIAPAGWSQDLSLSVTARATEGGQTAVSSIASTTVVINAPPTGANLSSNSVGENASNGTTIGTVNGVDPDAGDPLTYTLIDNAGGRFSITLAGVLKVADGSLLNYETAISHGITVRVTDGFGKYVDQPLTVAINNVNEANSFSGSYSMSVNENLNNAVVGTVRADDLDGSGVAYGQQRYYFWNGSASGTSSDGRYTIDAISGQIRTAAALNFEAGNAVVNYSVIARDNQGNAGFNQVSTTVSIGINNVNEAPVLNALSAGIDEQPGNPMLWQWQVLASDPDNDPAKRNFYYSLSGTDSNYFLINNSTGQIALASALNFEDPNQPKSFNLTVDLWDQGNGGGNHVSTTFTATVQDVNESPNISYYGIMKLVVDYNYSSYNGYIDVTISDPDTKPEYSGVSALYLSGSQAAGMGYWWGDPQWESVPDPTFSPYGSGFRAIIPYWNAAFSTTITARDNGNVSASRAILIEGVTDDNISPIVLDLDGDGAELISLVASTARFDMNNDGVRDLTGWASADDGILAIDLNGNGLIDDGNEIAFQPKLDGAVSDLEGLRLYDSNGDNFITAADEQFANFRVWQDLNQDGVSDSGELRTLAEAGIASLSLTLNLTGNTPQQGSLENTIYGTSFFERTDGSIGEVGDVMFSYVADSSIAAVFGSHRQAVAIDLSGDGISITDLRASTVTFAMADDGSSVATAWIGANDAMLVADIDGDGVIDSGTELSLGDDSFGHSLLTQLDENGDDRVDVEDSGFTTLRLWQDSNQDGISQVGELTTLGNAGVQALTVPDWSDPFILGTGESRTTNSFTVEYADGSIGSGSDVFLAHADQLAQAMASFAPSGGSSNSSALSSPDNDPYQLAASAA
jgi:Ca2+-binding RTX toxin-like protein